MQPENGVNFDYSKSVKISNTVYWVGHYDKKVKVQHNSYLILSSGKSVLIDTGSVISSENLLNKLKEITDPAKLDYIVVTHQDPDVCGNLDQIMDKLKGLGNNNCTIITHQRTASFLVHITNKYKILFANTLKDSTLKISADFELKFISTPYLHSPGSIVVFYKDEKILFSSDLFGGDLEEWTLFAKDNYADGIEEFHQQYMPSKEILLYGMTQIENLDIRLIAPHHGSIIPAKLARSLITKFKNFECGILINKEFRDELVKAKTKIELQNRIMKEELLMAANFQKSLLPPNHLTSLENEIMISYSTVPQFSVSGDFVIIDQIDSENLALMIIDVVGHGVTAGLATIQVKTLFESAKKLISPSEILREINKSAFNIVDHNSYFTALLCIFNSSSSKVKIASASGIPPLFFDGQTKKHEVLNLSGTPVGMSDDEDFSIGEIEIEMHSDDILILQTDGLIEATNAEQVQFDNALTQANIAKIVNCRHYPKDIIESIIKTVWEFGGGKKFQDDYTIAAIKKL